MKLTGRHLRQIIKEELQKEGVFSGIGDLAAGFGEGFFEKELHQMRGEKELRQMRGQEGSFYETEEDIKTFLKEAREKLWKALDVASRLNPGLALEIGPLAHSVGELLDEEPTKKPTEEQEEEKIP